MAPCTLPRSDAFHTWPPLVDQSTRFIEKFILVLRVSTNKEDTGVKEGRMTVDHLGLPRNDSRPNSPSVHKMPSSDAMRLDEDDDVV